MSAKIIGPFERRQLVVDGWTVPFLDVGEADGGRIHFVVDHRMGFSVGAADFEQVASLVANAIAVAIGMPCHPSSDASLEDREHLFRHVQHPALAPSQVKELVAIADDDGTNRADLKRRCDHCGTEGTLVDGACYDCAVICSGGSCESPADPGAFGGMCPDCREWLLA